MRAEFVRLTCDRCGVARDFGTSEYADPDDWHELARGAPKLGSYEDELDLCPSCAADFERWLAAPKTTRARVEP